MTRHGSISQAALCLRLVYWFSGCRLGVKVQALGFGGFRILGVPYFGVLFIRILLIGYYVRVPYFRKLPLKFRVQDSGQFSVQGMCVFRI